MNLQSLVPPQKDLAQRKANVTWKDGIVFTVRYITKATILEILSACQTWDFDPNTQKRVQRPNIEKFADSLGAQIVVGWSGLTLKKLFALMPLDSTKITPEELNKDIEFSQENLKVMLINCNGLDEFLQSAAMDIELFQSPETEGLSKNSMSSPSGT